VPIELASSLAVQAPVERLLELVLDPAVRAAVLCGHGEQLRGLLRLLMGSVSFYGPLRLEKGSIWILDVRADTVGAAHYVPPLRLQRPTDMHRLTSAEAG
jgi:broad specificity phosphatase PhoE